MNTKVKTLRGAGIIDMYTDILQVPLQDYKNVILQTGTIDMGRDLKLILMELTLLLEMIKCKNPTIHIYICSAPPRYDEKQHIVPKFNEAIKEMLQGLLNVTYMDTYTKLVEDRDYISGDKYHISKAGTTALLQVVHSYVPILKNTTDDSAPIGSLTHVRQVRQRPCWNCGLRNHDTQRCTFVVRLKCRLCGKMGHKEKVCKSERDHKPRQGNKRSWAQVQRSGPYDGVPYRYDARDFPSLSKVAEKHGHSQQPSAIPVHITPPVNETRSTSKPYTFPRPVSMPHSVNVPLPADGPHQWYQNCMPSTGSSQKSLASGTFREYSLDFRCYFS